MTDISSKNAGSRPIRVYVDGCFDMAHFGHANFLRQAKLLGDHLVVGVHSDEEIAKHKGPPVFNQEERCKLVEAIKWVDEVIVGTPFSTTPEILDRYDCVFACHGDDVSLTADGEDSSQAVKKAGRFRTVARTHGVSTTDIVGRMLLATKTHHKRSEDLPDENTMRDIQKDATGSSPRSGVSQFLATNQKIVQFSGSKFVKSTHEVIYVAGAFDCFHIGHLTLLERAFSYGDYVVVGLHTDAEVNRYCGSNYPIMNLHERVLSVLACRYVDEVVIGAPYKVTAELLSYFNVAIVVHGGSEGHGDVNGTDPYEEAKRQGKFRLVGNESSVTTPSIVQRIIENREKFEERNRTKSRKEFGSLNLVKKDKNCLNARLL